MCLSSPVFSSKNAAFFIVLFISKLILINLIYNKSLGCLGIFGLCYLVSNYFTKKNKNKLIINLLVSSVITVVVFGCYDKITLENFDGKTCASINNEDSLETKELVNKKKKIEKMEKICKDEIFELKIKINSEKDEKKKKILKEKLKINEEKVDYLKILMNVETN
tara:strand:- start:99 stop:593 length:495 start_codon:yes stop_codon:yes gene_type:complete